MLYFCNKISNLILFSLFFFKTFLNNILLNLQHLFMFKQTMDFQEKIIMYQQLNQLKHLYYPRLNIRNKNLIKYKFCYFFSFY